ncbi:transcriptional regulator [Terrilactibacillus sp. BCM23-1]|uniref:Transcriptional regulator n=1 Tax=Terrilactibacillus tamarindi TaxID=2599694 RepID=A0A6N8CS69_9BACI|nr:transcriptional regulator [Terrilactibacillus tamarindi]MTT32891.1 transcriptional regulator [Terrilactibacillus tamarindi]
MSSQQIVVVILAAIILLTQGTLLFLDARKRQRHAWLWGIVGLIQFPVPSLVYYFVVIKRYNKT